MPATSSRTRPRASRPSSTNLPAGLEAEVTGPAGFTTDAIDVFNDINGTLLYATAALVLILLIVIYRSPIFWLIPFFAVVLAEVSSRGFGYLLAEAGVTVTGQSGGILPVLVFGAGTDYALLDGLAISRGAAPPRGQARRDPRRPAPHLPGDPRLRRNRDGGAVDPVSGRGQRHRRTRPDRRDGDRPGDGLDAHHAAGAPDRVRAPGVLALHPALRQPGSRRDPRRLAAGRRVGGPRAAPRPGSERPPCSRCWRSA